MAAFILSVASAVVLGTALWLLIGPRIKFGDDPVQNQVLNVITYIAVAFLITFPVVVLFISDTFL